LVKPTVRLAVPTSLATFAGEKTLETTP
jgi:hypothetical protein